MLRTRSHWLVAALIASSVLTATTVSYAQQQPTPAPKGDRMLSRMQRNLGLTDDQVSKIRAIYQQHRDAHHTIWQSLRQAQTELACDDRRRDALEYAKTHDLAHLFRQAL